MACEWASQNKGEDAFPSQHCAEVVSRRADPPPADGGAKSLSLLVLLLSLIPSHPMFGRRAEVAHPVISCGHVTRVVDASKPRRVSGLAALVGAFDPLRRDTASSLSFATLGVPERPSRAKSGCCGESKRGFWSVLFSGMEKGARKCPLVLPEAPWMSRCCT
jgi:hypothetical protein